ncbi:sigma-70 family RNA polymerase sigma factor [Brevibacillus agri]|uniref:sigma-70 family RNA polymerase sigma factor n=1 Tax=Brevibacillus agri TaxID=51101 RepID=UPI0021006106|nr:MULTISPECIES: sigma-70 family RNA polymerase sigma factor [Brevibacillus]
MASWFLKGLQHEMYRLSKKHCKIRRHEELSLNAPLSDDASVELVELLPLQEQHENDLSISLRDALSRLSPRQFYVIRSIFLYGYTEQEVSKQLKISQPAVNKIKKAALKKLQNDLREWKNYESSR